MWKFLGKVIIAALTVICLFLCGNFIWYKYLNRSRITAFEVYDAISLAEQNTGYTSLVLGDSVTRQIFNPACQSESTDTAYLATNQAVTAAGNYMLVRRFHENNPQLRDVYYIATPDSFLSNVNFIYTYSYFITPLYNDSFKKYLDNDTCANLEKTFGSLFADGEFCKWMLAKYPKLLEIYQSSRQKAFERSVAAGQASPDLSMPYIQAMQKYCSENDITLHLLFSPVPEGCEFDASDYAFIKEYGGDAQYQGLMDSLISIDAGEFSDGTHLKKDYIAKHRESLREKLVNP